MVLELFSNLGDSMALSTWGAPDKCADLPLPLASFLCLLAAGSKNSSGLKPQTKQKKIKNIQPNVWKRIWNSR